MTACKNPACKSQAKPGQQTCGEKVCRNRVSNMRRPANRKAAVKAATKQGKAQGAAAVHADAVVAVVRETQVREGAPGRKIHLPQGGVVLVLPPGLRRVLSEHIADVEICVGATQGAIDRVKVAAKDLRQFHATEREAVADLCHLLREMMKASDKQGRIR